MPSVAPLTTWDSLPFLAAVTKHVLPPLTTTISKDRAGEYGSMPTGDVVVGAEHLSYAFMHAPAPPTTDETRSFRLPQVS